MPPIELNGLKSYSALGSVRGGVHSDASQETSSPRNGTPQRGKLWPRVRTMDSRALFEARVLPLTLSSLLRDDSTGAAPLNQAEAESWATARKLHIN